MNGGSLFSAFFGGSFDPIHRGHLYIARLVHETTPYQSILFVPNRTNPLKQQEPSADGIHRLEMIKLAIADMPWCAVSSAEVDREEPSYTVDTIELLLREGILQESPGMIIGDDLLEELPRWHDYERLRSLVTPIVLQREKGPVHRQNALPEKTLVIRNRPMEVSSSEVRRRLRRGEPVRELLPERVYEYIRTHKPYN